MSFVRTLEPLPAGQEAPALAAEEELRMAVPDVEYSAVQDGEPASRGSGTLFVGSKSLYWFPADGGEGFAAGFRNVTMHAVCRDPQTFPAPCLYVQLSSSSGEESVDGHFTPSDSELLPDIFAAFSQGAEENPDSAAEDDSGDEGAGPMFDISSFQSAAPEEGEAGPDPEMLARFDAMLASDQLPPSE